MNKKQLVVDLETTGTLENGGAIYEICAIAIINGVKKGKFHAYLIPHEGANLEFKSKDFHKESKDPSKVYSAFKKFMDCFVKKYDPEDKFEFVAYNVNFDFNFILKWAALNEDKYIWSYFTKNPLCLYHAVNFLLSMTGQKQVIKNLKLGTVCKFFQIPVKEDKLHGADYDTEITLKLMRKINQMSKPLGKINYDKPKRKISRRATVSSVQSSESVSVGMASVSPEILSEAEE